MLDFDYPPDFMPRAMRDDPSHVLALDIDVGESRHLGESRRISSKGPRTRLTPPRLPSLCSGADVAVRFDSKAAPRPPATAAVQDTSITRLPDVSQQEPLFDLGAQPGLSDFTSVAAVDNDAPTSSSWLARRVGEVPRD